MLEERDERVVREVRDVRDVRVDERSGGVCGGLSWIVRVRDLQVLPLIPAHLPSVQALQ